MKRVLVFFALLVLGFVALRLAIGDEAVVTGNTRPQAKPSTTSPSPTPTTGPGVAIEQKGHRAMLSMKGPFDMKFWRTLPPVNGVAEKQLVFTLKARSSEPVAEGKQQLDDVEVMLFDDGVHAGTLHAKQAFVSLRPDAAGNPSIDEGKDIDMRDAVFTGVPGGRLAGLRLELATARVKVEDDSVQLVTPRDEPVLVELDGERALKLRGRGAQARLPRGRKDGLRRADVEILTDPVLEAEGMVVRANGRMHMIEDVDAGTGTITLEDHVTLDFKRAHAALPRVGAGSNSNGNTVTELHVRGDQFLGWFLRTRTFDATGKPRDARDWRQVVLTGAPATIEMPGAKLSTPKVTAVAGLFGTPGVVTAHGGESKLEQTSLRPHSRQKELVRATATRRLHFAMPREQLGALHASFGFPRWTMAPLQRLQIAIAEGTARLQDKDQLLEAKDGVRMTRFDGSNAGIVRGLGPVHVEQRATTGREQDLVADASDGFLLTVSDDTEHLQLGPAAPADTTAAGPWRTHTFDVRHGNATLRGVGVCDVTRKGDDVHVHFVSPDDRVTAALPDERLALAHVHELAAHFASRDLLALDVVGWPVEAQLTDGSGNAVARAPRMLQTGPRSLRLLPVDPARAAQWSGLPAVDRTPVLRRTSAASKHVGAQQIEVRGPAIDVHHVGARDVVVDAITVAGELPHIYARIEPVDGGEATTLACGAERMRILPFVLSPAARRWLVGASGAFADASTLSLRQSWLCLDDVREFQLDEPRQGHIEGKGRRLFVSQAARTAVFLGDAATATPAETVLRRGDTTATFRGARVRATREDTVQLQALASFGDDGPVLAPTMTLRDAAQAGLFSHMRATCRGDIEAGDEAVQFRGPVVAESLDDAGAVDPNGMRIDAQTLHLTRDPTTHTITLIRGGDVLVDWTRLYAKCHEVELDLRTGRVLAADPVEALVRFANGVEVASPRIEANYQTFVFSSAPGRLSRRDTGRQP